MKSKFNQKGAIAILVALLLPMFIGMMALAIDVGYILLNRQRMQVAADSAALVAAGALRHGWGIESAESLAFKATADNGFTNNNNNTQVSISIPPGGNETFANDDQFVRVTVSQPINVFLAWIFGVTNTPTSAMAVSGPSGNGMPCMLTLQTTLPGALTAGGNSQLRALHCGVYVNSTNEQALKIGSIENLVASIIQVVGGCDGKVCPDILNLATGMSATADPFENLDMSKEISSDCVPKWKYKETPGKELFLDQGTYCETLKLTSSSIVHFSEGVYVLYGGGMEVTSKVALEGRDITFYNTGGGAQYGGLKLAGSGSMNITAPTTGDYAGMLFVQDSRNTQIATINGNSTSNLAGNFYFPNNELKLDGTAGTVVKIGVVVARTIDARGGAKFEMTNSYGGLGGSGSTGTLRSGLYQ